MASRTKTTEAARGDRELTLKAAAEMTGCSGKLLRRYIREGRLRPASMDGNRMTVTLAAIREAGLLPAEPGGVMPARPIDDDRDDEAEEAEAQAERDRAEKERERAERAEKERVERERAEKERAERERAEKERAEKERLERERVERDKAEKARVEKERAERERAEREKADRARAEKERAERERAERERADREKAERARAEKERAERERADREKAERERAERERSEKSRLERERAEREKAERARAERDRLKAEKARSDAERDRAERDRAERDRAEREKAEAAKVVPLARPKPAPEDLDDVDAMDESDELDDRDLDEMEDGLDDLQDEGATVRLEAEPRVEVVGEAMRAERSLVVAGSGPWVTTNQLTDLMRMLAAEREARSQEYVERTEALYREMIETQKKRISSLEDEARSLQSKLEDALRMVPKGENVSALEQMVRDLRIEIDRKEAARADLEHERDRLRDLTDRLRNDLSRADKRNLEMAEQLRRFRAQGIFDRLVGREPDDR